MFSVLTAGTCLVVTGAIGYDLSYLHGFFAGGQWTDRVIWWQVALGIALLALGAYWFQRLLPEEGSSGHARRLPMTVNVGAGRTASAELKRKQLRSPTSGPTA
jgi:hypothetical protein